MATVPGTSRPGSATALDALRGAALLDTPPEARFDRITHLVRDVLGVPVCLVSLIDAERQFFKSAPGLSEPWASRRETPLSHSLCKHVVASRRPLVVTDVSVDPRLGDSHAASALGVVAYLGVPIHVGVDAVGALAAIDRQPRAWSAAEIARLEDFAALIDSEIELGRLAMEREAARRDAELIAGEAAHRAKNSLTVAASLISLSLAESETPDDLARLARERIMALSSVQDMLRGEDADGDLRALLDRVLGPYGGQGKKRVIRIDGGPIRLPQEKLTPIGLIFHELATNACKHGALSRAGGSIDLGWTAGPGGLTIRWAESTPQHAAAGRQIVLPEAAVDGRPGFGMRLIDLCVRQLHGRITIGEDRLGGRLVELVVPLDSGG